jgi:hypothetical protein
MENIIISDFDLTLSKKNILYPYLLLLFYLKCTSTKDRIVKYIKIILLPFISIIFGFIYILFDESKCLKSINYFLFFNTKKQNIISTIYLIKYYIIKNLNTKVLDSIRSYNSNYKYIISGNFEEIVNIALEQYDFNVYGSSLSIDNNIYTGFTTFICLGKNKQIILDKIISHQEEIGKTKKQINLIVYGDSINDYYLLKKANIRYVVGSNSELINVLNKKN